MTAPDYAVFLKSGQTAYVSGEPGRSDEDPGWIVFFGEDDETTGMFPEADVAFIRTAERREPLVVTGSQDIADQQRLTHAAVISSGDPRQPQFLEVEHGDGTKLAYRITCWSPDFMGGTRWSLEPA